MSVSELRGERRRHCLLGDTFWTTSAKTLMETAAANRKIFAVSRKTHSRLLVQVLYIYSKETDMSVNMELKLMSTHSDIIPETLAYSA